MVPAVVLEALAEGLAFFRRVLAISSQIESVMDVTQEISESFDDDLRNHKTIMGEQLYLFILGRQFIAGLPGYDATRQDDIDGYVLEAITLHMSKKTSPELKATIMSFANTLGQVMQGHDPDFLSKAETSIKGDRFVLIDPVYEFMKTYEHMPQPMPRIAKILGVSDAQWSGLHKAVTENILSRDWRDVLTNLPKTSRPGRSHTFTGLVMKGARSAAQDIFEAIPVTEGPAGIALTTALLPLGQHGDIHPSALPDWRSITTEMVQTTSRQIMAARGYVQTKEGWYHTSEVNRTEDKDGGVVFVPKSTVFVVESSPEGKPPKTIGVSNEQALQGLEKLAKVLTRFTEKKVTDKLK